MHTIFGYTFIGSPSKKNAWSVSPLSHFETTPSRTFCQDAFGYGKHFETDLNAFNTDMVDCTIVNDRPVGCIAVVYIIKIPHTGDKEYLDRCR